MSKFLSHQPLKSNTRLQKAWQRKSEEKEQFDSSLLFKEKRKRTKVELLEVVAHGPHRLQLVTQHTCIMFINTPGFKLPIEPEGRMSIKRTNTSIGAEYHITFAGLSEWTYIKAVFAAFAFMGKI